MPMGRMLLQKKIEIPYFAKMIFFSLTCLTFVCWQVGYFTIKSGQAAGGYGFYRMNLNSIVNSSGWSHILSSLPQGSGDYEGFNFLGLGVILLLIVAAPNVLKLKSAYKILIKQYWLFILLFFCFFLYSITHTFAFGSFEVKLSMPPEIMKYANIFRASGRFFWPVYYCIVLISIYLTALVFSKRVATVLLGFAFLIQMVDTGAGWKGVRSITMQNPSSSWKMPLSSPFWKHAASQYTHLRIIPTGNHISPDWKTFAYYAGLHQIKSGAVFLARVDENQADLTRKIAEKSIETGEYDPKTLYILDDTSFINAQKNADLISDLFARVDGFNVIAPKWQPCADCEIQ
jgi:hypothetical protein